MYLNVFYGTHTEFKYHTLPYTIMPNVNQKHLWKKIERKNAGKSLDFISKMLEL